MKWFSRKFVLTIVLAVILLWVFRKMGVAMHDPITFGIWLAGLLANFGIYTTGNAMAKKAQGDK